MDDSKFETIWAISKSIFDYNIEGKRDAGRKPAHSAKDIFKAVYWIKDS